ncbi:hypothetical protein [Nannocystis radixulma]|uniref:Uncharacterized protein n=1 Tax=Nannocystis radixulma TaxID=2995305 RepID=A0ABT5B903_9BACT|nr:hypothetical protein [Nannocystis radixulma]MDC0670606.1 hypothetical protein [Nannocystis radixulma]
MAHLFPIRALEIDELRDLEVARRIAGRVAADLGLPHLDTSGSADP